MGKFNLLRGAKDEEVKIEGAATLVGCVDDGFALRREGGVIMVDTFMRSLEEAATITVNHADLVIVTARAGENEPPAMNAGRAPPLAIHASQVATAATSMAGCVVSV